MERLRITCMVLTLAALSGCAGTSKSGSTGVAESTAAPSSAPPSTTAPAGRVHKLASGLIYEDLVIGNGTMADPGLMVSVNYTGRLTTGEEFDSSARAGRPLRFQLGASNIIAGWNQGIKGMRIGGKRKLTIPPDMGYGASGSGDVIPPNATLVFEVELVAVQ